MVRGGEPGGNYCFRRHPHAAVEISGGTNTAETIDLAAHQAEYTPVLLDPDPALTPAKAMAWFAAQKSRPGVTIIIMQAHNLPEMSVANLNALLDAIDADDEVTTLTMREVAHYVREYSTSEDGRLYTGKVSSGRVVKRFKSALVGVVGWTIERLGSGVAFAIKVDGEQVATLDNILVMLKAGISQLEQGHNLCFFSTNNESFTAFQQLVGKMFDVDTQGGIVRLRGEFRAWSPGKAITAYNPSTGQETFAVDTTRGTVYMRSLSALPTDTAR